MSFNVTVTTKDENGKNVDHKLAFDTMEDYQEFYANTDKMLKESGLKRSINEALVARYPAYLNGSTLSADSGVSAGGQSAATGGATYGQAVSGNSSGGSQGGGIDYYEQFLQNSGSRYETIKQNAIDTAGNVKDAAYKDAEVARERAVVNARSAGAQNKATYGANAEQLGAMGLTTSGYSDYINANAYATERAEVQSANAQATYAQRIADENYNQAVANANATYEENMITVEGTLAKYRQEKADKAEEEMKAYEEKRKENYISVMNGINDGTITPDNVKQYITQLGFSETDPEWQELVAHAQDVETNNNNAKILAEDAAQDKLYREVLLEIEKGTITPDNIDEYLAGLDLTDEDLITKLKGRADEIAKANETAATEELSAIQTENYWKIKANLDAYSDDDLDYMVENELLLREDGEKLKGELRDARANEINNLINYGDLYGATALADQMFEAGQIDKPTYQTAYFNAALINCEGATIENAQSVYNDLTRLKTNDKLSKADYDAAVKYLYSQFAKIINCSTSLTGKGADIKVNGTCYDVTFVGEAIENHELLDKVSGENKKAGTLVEFANVLYIYTFTGWRVIDTWGDTNFKKVYDNNVLDGYAITPARPKSSNGSSTTDRLK